MGNTAHAVFFAMKAIEDRVQNRTNVAAVMACTTSNEPCSSRKQSSDDEECSAKGRNRHIVVSKAELSNSIEVLESFKLARESWELLHSLEFLDKGELCWY